jgi:hypothetical protein
MYHDFLQSYSPPDSMKMRLIRTCRIRGGAVLCLLGHCSGDLRLITPLPRERVYQRQPATEESKVLRQPPECQIASLPNTTNAAANHGLKNRGRSSSSPDFLIVAFGEHGRLTFDKEINNCDGSLQTK